MGMAMLFKLRPGPPAPSRCGRSRCGGGGGGAGRLPVAGSRARPGKESPICALPAAGWAGPATAALRPDLAASAIMIASGSASLGV